jgi:tetratricopeptide (TPR) repeat protein
MTHRVLATWPEDLPAEYSSLQSIMSSRQWNEFRDRLRELSASDSVPDQIRAILHNNLGVAYQELGLNNLAVESYEQANALGLSAGNTLASIVANYNLGNLYYTEMRWEPARHHLDQVIILSNKRPSEFSAYSVLATDLRTLTLTEKHTISTNDQIPASQLTVKDQVERSRAVASVYSNAGLIAEAIIELEQADQLCKVHQLDGLDALVLNELAIAMGDVEKNDDATACFSQALDAARRAGRKATEASIQNNWALLLKKLGQSSKAIARFEAALSIKRELGDQASIGNVLYNLASLYYPKQQLDEAQRFAEAAIRADEQHDPNSLASDKELLKLIRQSKV